MNTTNVSPSVELARQHQRAGRFREAEAVYRQVLAQNQDHPVVLHHLGLLMHQGGRPEAAADFMYRAISADPDVPEVYNNLATVLGQLGRYPDALNMLDQALGLDPAYAEAHSNRGIALDKLGRRDEAVAAFRKAVELRPDYFEARSNLGSALARAGRLDEAIDHLRAATVGRSRNPGARAPVADAFCGLGAALQKRGDLDGAIAAFRNATEARPDFAEAYTNLGNALKESGRLADAIAALRKAVELRPSFPDAHWNLALALLLAGDFHGGWLEYEWRRHLKEDAAQQRPFPQPVWNGAPVSGRTLLLLSEQGLGDTIQFIRYAPLLAARGATVIVECQPKLRPLLQTVKGIHRVIARGEPLPAFDAHARLLTLPGTFGTDLQSIPADVPYLHAEPDQVVRWTARLRELAPDALRVGIAWQGSPTFGGDAQRSMPLRHFAPLAACPGVRLFSLQKGFGAEQVRSLPEPFPVIEFSPPLDETSGAFVETAAVMAGLDLVITSDTSLAHLAGALGVPTWVVLSFVPDWRWLTERPDSPWYPSVTLFRQTARGDWDGVFARVAAALRSRGRGEVASATTPPCRVTVPASVGELLDKIAILQIKAERITDASKLAHVRAELEALLGVRREVVPLTDELETAAADLQRVNEDLWQAEDEIRRLERAGDFGPSFTAVARSICAANDRRSELKRRINIASNSALVEEKYYG